MKIKNEIEYDAAIERVGELMSKASALSEAEGIELNELADEISEYEDMIIDNDT